MQILNLNGDTYNKSKKRGGFTMSEVINNREYRQRELKKLIMELHDGKPVEEVKEKFNKIIEGISVSEISQLEQALIMEGMPIAEVQRLCDVHAALFKGSIEEIHREGKPEDTPGHPIHTFKLENREIEKFIKEEVQPLLKDFKQTNTDETSIINQLKESIDRLLEVDKHYSRKENLMFPYLEKYGISAPPKVMWGVDDEIREQLKEVNNLLSSYKGNRDEIVQKTEDSLNKVSEMIFKEENILFPMALETLTEDEWAKIAEESDEIGYTFITPQKRWMPQRKSIEKYEKGKEVQQEGVVSFETGSLTFEEINLLLNSLPFDITFVDKDDIVKYFSQGKDRIFTRTKSVIGRKVQNCHPPASVHVVEKIVADFKAGKKDVEEFWIRMGERYVHIRYFALRNEKGEYMGTMEVTQDIAPIQKISGEKRLMSNE